MIDTLVKLSMSNGWPVQKSAAAVLATIHPSDPEQRSTIVVALVKMVRQTASVDANVRQSVADALAAAIGASNFGWQKTVVDNLVQA